MKIFFFYFDRAIKIIEGYFFSEFKFVEGAHFERGYEFLGGPYHCGFNLEKYSN